MNIRFFSKRVYLLPLFGIFFGVLVSLLILSLVKSRGERKTQFAVIQTNYGDITITFRDQTPIAKANFIKLSKSGFYNETRFHRAVKDFMIQGGDPLSINPDLKSYWGKGGPGYTFKDEIFEGDKMVKGVVAMVNSGPDTNGSQFFIITAEDASWLNGKHTIFADVSSGMENSVRISQIPTNVLGFLEEDVIISSIDIR